MAASCSPRGGSALVDMTYYENAVHAMWLASQPACDHLPSARAWNISNGEPRTLRSIVQKLIDELGIKCRIRSVLSDAGYYRPQHGALWR